MYLHLLAVAQAHQQALAGLGAAAQGFELRQQLWPLQLPGSTQQMLSGQPQVVCGWRGRRRLRTFDQTRQLLRQLSPILRIQLNAEIDRQLTDMSTYSNHKESPRKTRSMLPRLDGTGQRAFLVIT